MAKKVKTIAKKESPMRSKPEPETKPEPEVPMPKKLSFKVEKERIMFKADGRELFYIDREDALFLFGTRPVEIEFEKLAGTIDNFDDLNTPDFLARFQVAYAHFGNIDQTAKFLGQKTVRLGRWLADDSRKWRNQQIGTEEHSRLMEKYRNEYFPPEVPKAKEKSTKLDLKKVATMLDKKMSLNDIADSLGFKYRWEEFITTYNSQIKEIQKIQRQRRAKEHGESILR